MIEIKNKQPGQRILEIGCGANPHVKPECQGGTDVTIDARMCHDAEGKQTVDIVWDLNNPLPIGDGDFDFVLSHFCMEHLSWQKVRSHLKDVLRVLKPGGKYICAIPNTESQYHWIQNHVGGWDNKSIFEAASELLYGTQDYKENAHQCFFSPHIVNELFTTAGFSSCRVDPYGERNTDMIVTGTKSPELLTNRPFTGEAAAVDAKKAAVQMFQSVMTGPVTHTLPTTNPSEIEIQETPPHQLFDKDYFNGGGKVGGYSREGYWDYPVHEITARHMLNKRPKSALEIGAARGYIVKRLQDNGLRACGMEVSRHCWMTRACQGIINFDICQTPWPWKDQEFDLCYSIATLEHIPEKYLPSIIEEMIRVSVWGCHGIDFGDHDDGFDKTHCTLKPRGWWEDLFRKYAGQGYPVEIMDKEDLERGEFPRDVAQGDGKLKLNVGSFTTMHHHGWINIDQHNLGQFAQHYGYHFIQANVVNGLPMFNTGTVDLIMANHFLEHLTYQQGLSFLRECRRLLKPDTGAIRLVVPDASKLCYYFSNPHQRTLDEFAEISNGVTQSPTEAMKLWELLMSGHQAIYDSDTINHQLKQAGFEPVVTSFRENGFNRTGCKQILRETIDMQPELSLYVDAIPHG